MLNAQKKERKSETLKDVDPSRVVRPTIEKSENAKFPLRHYLMSKHSVRAWRKTSVLCHANESLPRQKNSTQQQKKKESLTENPSRTHRASFKPPSRSQRTSFTPNLHNLLARSPVHAICSASSLPSRRTSTTATQIAGSRHSSASSLPSRRTSTTATQIARAERFRRRRVRRSLETNLSRREPRSKECQRQILEVGVMVEEAKRSLGINVDGIEDGDAFLEKENEEIDRSGPPLELNIGSFLSHAFDGAVNVS
ncbi:uncharacterized protein LOC126691371 [Quercus robur]|uniref:uncharacterized protein LOC126691371 n=1 Tax=Quercus robur TaxID=38942 RepID=UPI0021617B66|nr:uncharacterized protein LOC126691371 [Quercus robur]